MATFKKELAVAFGTQSVEGTADPTIAALGGNLTLASGIVLGDPEVGDDKSGIEISIAPVRTDGGFVSGGFTARAGSFLRKEVSFSFSFLFAGNRLTTPATPLDSSFVHEKGMLAILRSIGLFGVGSATPGQNMTPADAGFITAKVFHKGGWAWVLKDVKCKSATFGLTPSGKVKVKCDFSGFESSRPTVAFPGLDYEEQGTVDPPSVVAVSPSWGISDEVRGWETLSITYANDIQEKDDSAATEGKFFEQQGRSITIDMKMKDTTTDADFALTELERTNAPTADLKMTIGTPAVGLDPALAFRIEVRNLSVQQYTPEGNSISFASVTAQATDATSNGAEFLIEFL